MALHPETRCSAIAALGGDPVLFMAVEISTVAVLSYKDKLDKVVNATGDELKHYFQCKDWNFIVRVAPGELLNLPEGFFVSCGSLAARARS